MERVFIDVISQSSEIFVQNAYQPD